MLVIDCSLYTMKHIDCLKDSNVGVVFRYYARKPQPGYEEKILKHDENVALSKANIKIGVVYQYNARSSSKFNHQQGLDDGRLARKYAHEIVKQPEGSAIYFGVDYDVTPHEDIGTHIVPHFKGLAEAINENVPYAVYGIGVYGAWNVLDRLDKEKLVNFKWLSQSTGHGCAAERKKYVDSKAWDLLQGITRTDLCDGFDTIGIP